MSTLTGKSMVVVGGSGGVGRRVVEAGIRQGARVLAVARQEGPLGRLTQEFPGVEVLALDASDEHAPDRVFNVVRPDVLVLCVGVFPPVQPLHQLSWHEFAVNWEADVKIAFHFCKAALLQPLPADAKVILISSGAAIGGSPISGGYAGAKRTQIFMANYAQKESDRLGLGIRFIALAPRIMPDTELGKYAIAGYSRYLDMPEADFIQGMGPAPSATDVANAAIGFAANIDRSNGIAFVISGAGVEALP
jgi:NAD(P)-dependent dehydrogenase (short-subunit alcohol dehydrogenase family)